MNETFKVMAQGMIRARREDGDFTPWNHNEIQFGIADIVGGLMSGDLKYKPVGAYIQYVNNMGSWTTPTDFGRDGKTYFHGLDDGISDIIRVPLLVNPSLSSSNTSIYGQNLVKFLARTAGADGAPGLIQGATVPFDRESSTVVGGAIIAMPDPDDYTKDLVLNRAYLGASEVLERPGDPHEIVVEWRVKFL